MRWARWRLPSTGNPDLDKDSEQELDTACKLQTMGRTCSLHYTGIVPVTHNMTEQHTLR